ncbi:hypothetical protein SAMN05443549_103208 [Flavobacterium fluvii]|uniref:Glycosyl transferase family 2 n=1 Tax=Flavobacterium fluvii TaxID=468056 RepID=A0A1M5ISF3_9FLAO|nr:hypothetical protein [Flavobacterium fluvii]SHG30880.1 hypothetical protein SAMN05443549_103208 [Flavobacterium fluvii]
MGDSNIAMLTTVINKELYQKSSQLFPKNIQKYVIDGTNGMHGLDSIFYMMQKLKGKSIEWLIMADEDVLFEDPNMVFDIIQKMKSENFTACGIRDGGLISHRVYNPYLMNTFFSIINFKEIEAIWNTIEVTKNQFIAKNEFDDDLSHLKGNYDVSSIYEPYYCFYLWLRRNKKQFLFLDSNQPFQEDPITNVVYFEEKVLLYHTWYARSYGVNKKHTNRINKILKILKFENKIVPTPIVFKHKTFFIIQKVRKINKRIMMRIQIVKKMIVKE